MRSGETDELDSDLLLLDEGLNEFDHVFGFLISKLNPTSSFILKNLLILFLNFSIEFSESF